jgi:protein-disulfide isomerase
LSEQPVPEMTPPESLEIPTMETSSGAPVSSAPTVRPKWIAPAWFFFGIIVGIVGFAAYNAVIIKSAAPAPTPVAQLESLEPNALRAAARDGTLDAIATLQASGGQAAQQQPQGPQAAGENAFTVRAANREGNPDAKITVYEFADYQCPFCKRNHDVVGPELRKQYVDSGKINIVFKHFTFLGQESIWAAQAAECAADQGKFWEYHDLLFAKQGSENGGTFTKENLIKYAQELKLDASKFDPCLNNDETLERVKADTLEGRNVGVTGTPTFFINGKPLVGAQPLQAFQQQIDGLLGQ